MTRSPTRSAILIAALLSATFHAPAFAQTADAEAPATETLTETPATETPPAETPADAAPAESGAMGESGGGEALSTGEPVADASRPNIYLREEHGDWEIRCLEAPEGQEDPCQMFQRLTDQNGNPTADVNIFDLPDGEGEILAGATVVTPLQTLLTAQLTMSIDGGQPRRYPFSFCDPAGCYARLGFTAEDLASLRRGASATLIVVPAQAPDQRAELTMSLTGFTAGFEAVTLDE